jgi:hypothetical protein
MIGIDGHRVHMYYEKVLRAFCLIEQDSLEWKFPELEDGGRACLFCCGAGEK